MFLEASSSNVYDRAIFILPRKFTANLSRVENGEDVGESLV